MDVSLVFINFIQHNLSSSYYVQGLVYDHQDAISV